MSSHTTFISMVSVFRLLHCKMRERKRRSVVRSFLWYAISYKCFPVKFSIWNVSHVMQRINEFLNDGGGNDNIVDGNNGHWSVHCVRLCLFAWLCQGSCHFIWMIGDAILSRHRPVLASHSLFHFIHFLVSAEYHVYLIFACVYRTDDHHIESCILKIY